MLCRAKIATQQLGTGTQHPVINVLAGFVSASVGSNHALTNHKAIVITCGFFAHHCQARTTSLPAYFGLGIFRLPNFDPVPSVSNLNR